MKKIAVAMSGGVDSTVAVVLLQEQGYEVIGMTLGGGNVLAEAQRLAEKIGIEHHSFQAKELFNEKVIDYFVDSYKEGLTPSPCVNCNRFVKFGFLADKAKELGCDKMATGHYAIKKDGKLFVAEDDHKDQTYFLFSLSQEQIDFCEFPLGEYDKPTIKDIAAKHGVMPKYGESQDLCFVDDGKYAEFVEERGGKLPEATIVDTKGNILKQYKSIVHYTIGQRKGLDIGGLAEPMYVMEIDAKNNKVVVGSRDELATLKVNLTEINWLGGDEKFDEVYVKLRYKQKLIPAELHLDEGYITLGQADFAVAPGQACVFYTKDNQLLGGGFIK
jgi:tRNA-uridine 2-sulfurtransferase